MNNLLENKMFWITYITISALLTLFFMVKTFSLFFNQISENPKASPAIPGAVKAFKSPGL